MLEIAAKQASTEIEKADVREVKSTVPERGNMHRRVKDVKEDEREVP